MTQHHREPGRGINDPTRPAGWAPLPPMPGAMGPAQGRWQSDFTLARLIEDIRSIFTLSVVRTRLPWRKR